MWSQWKIFPTIISRIHSHSVHAYGVNRDHLEETFIMGPRLAVIVCKWPSVVKCVQIKWEMPKKVLTSKNKGNTWRYLVYTINMAVCRGAGVCVCAKDLTHHPSAHRIIFHHILTEHYLPMRIITYPNQETQPLPESRGRSGISKIKFKPMQFFVFYIHSPMIVYLKAEGAPH